MTRKMYGVATMVATLLMALSTLAMAEPISGSISTKVLPKYVCGNGTVAHNKPVNQAKLGINLANGIYITGWDSTSIVGAGYGNEFDATIGYAGTPRVLSADRSIGIDVGLTYIDMTPLNTTKQDFISPYIEVSKVFTTGFAPYAKVDLYFVTTDGGAPTTRSHIGARHLWSIAKVVSLSQDLQVAYEYVPSAPGASSVTMQHSAILSWDIGKQVSLNLLNDFYAPLSGKGREVNVVPGIGATYKFGGK